MVFNEPLAIYVPKLATILQAIGPRLVVDDASLDNLMRLGSIQQRPILSEDAVRFDAQVPSQNGDGDNGKPYQLTPEGVAVIPMRGSLMKRYNFMSAASGLTTYQGLGQAATAAMADPQVKAILFDIDSPGGTTHGCFELSDMIYQMRGDKPMWSCANDLAASAAYALASATDRIFVTRTGGVGSVGVFALHADQSGLDEQAGVKYTYVYAGDKKVEGNPHEPLSKSAKADIQAEVDRENEIFVATVARNRGFASATAENIAATKAGVYFAQNAVPLMADEVGTFGETLEALTAKITGTRISNSGKVALLAESGNNASVAESAEAKQGEQPKGDAMPKAEEMKRAKKADEEAEAAAAEKKDEEDDEDEDDSKEKDDDAKGKKKAVRAASTTDEDDEDDKSARRTVAEMPKANSAVTISNLCTIAGTPELAAEYLIKGYSVDKVIEKLSARRAKASAEANINSFVAGDGGTGNGSGQESVDAAIKQSRIMSSNSGGSLKPSQCMERLLRSNPEIYTGYLEEKDRVMSQISHSGGGRILNDYVLNTQRRYMAQLGLGTTIDDVPGRRSM